jgi:ankyrin repeat protein
VNDKSGEMVLHGAAFNGHDVSVPLLLEHGPKVDANNEYGRTALHGAASNGHDAIVHLLLERRAEVDAKE